MTYSDSYRLLTERLGSLFDSGEVKSIARILYEDLFDKLGASTSSEVMTKDQVETFLDAQTRLVNGEPIDYITGVREFYGRRFKVDPSVLIPRQETEELVTWVVEDLGVSKDLRVVDIGTGSGCIPISIDLETKLGHHIHGLDISDVALTTARTNNQSLAASVRFDQCDILQDSLDAHLTYDVIISNPPYILKSESGLMNRQVLEHEPTVALFTDGDDPLIFYKRINEIAIQKMPRGGRLYYEISALHKDAMMDLMKADGFVDIECRKDMSSNWRMIKAIKQ